MFHDGIHPDGDFVNPRTFEIASCGSFQLVDFRKIMHRHFLIGDEIICYTSVDELRDLAKYYLKHPTERRKISDKGYKRVLHEHSYIHRMKEMLSVICDRKPDCFYRKKSSTFEIKDINSFCRQFPEATEIIADVKKRGWHTDIDHIVASIREKNGPLHYQEALFLLIKEYQSFFEGNAL